MLTKACPVMVKAGSDDGLDEGQFEAMVSVFGNVDSYGDRVVPGAFAETLAEWAKSGNPIPVLWSHRMDDPEMNLGYVIEAKENDRGLWVKGQLDLEQQKARVVQRLFAGRRVTQFSFAYDILDASWVIHDGEEVYELRKLKLYEVGPTPVGANQETELLNSKALHALAVELKAGRVLSAKNEAALRSAHEAIGGVLAALDDSNDVKARASDSAKVEDPSSGKTEEPEPVAARVFDLSELAAIELACESVA